MTYRRSTRLPARTRRVLAAGLALVAAVSSGVTPARAAPRWGPPVRIATAVHPGASAASADGTLFTVARRVSGTGLTTPLVLLRRAPSGRWSQTQLPYDGTPVAIADDGGTTFFLFTTSGQGRMELRIAEVPHGGRPAVSRLLDHGVHLGRAPSLIARDGRWWAAWVMANGRIPRPTAPADFVYTLREARTVPPAYGTRPLLRGAATDNTGLVPAAAFSPQLVWRGASQVLMTVNRPGFTEFWAADLPQGFHRTRSRVLDDNTTRPGGAETAVLTVGTRTFLAYVRGGRQVLAHDNADLRFTERVVFPAPAGSSSMLAASGGRIFLGHNRCFDVAGRFTCRGYVASGGLTGALHDLTDLAAPLDTRGSDIRSAVVGLTATDGRATAVFIDGNGGTFARDEA